MQVVSANSCRTTEIEGVGTMKLVYVGGRLRMGGDSLLLSVWMSVGDGFIGKGESYVTVVRTRNLHGSRMGYHRYILLKNKGVEERQRQKA